MKKIFVLMLIISYYIIGMKIAYAMTEKELLDKLTASYVVNGEKYSVPGDIKVLAERYLSQYEVSSEDADYISDRIDEAVSIIQKNGKVDFRQMSMSTKEQLKALVEKVSANTSVKATVMKNSIIIYTPSGEKFAEVDRLVKQTGNTNITSIIILSLFIVLVGTLFLKKEMNN